MERITSPVLRRFEAALGQSIEIAHVSTLTFELLRLVAACIFKRANKPPYKTLHKSPSKRDNNIKKLNCEHS